MNRVQLVQVIVIIMAMMLGYQMIVNFISFASSAVSYFAGYGVYSTDFIIYYGLSALLYAIGLFTIINSASKISLWVIEKVQPDENMQLGFTDTSVLYAVLLFITLGALLKNVPGILYDLYEAFTETTSNGRIKKGYIADVPGFDWRRLIETIIAFILLVYIKPVANYFHQKIDPHDPHFINDEAEPLPEE